MRRWYYAVPLLAAAIVSACSDRAPTEPRATPTALGGLGVSGAGYTTFVDVAACLDGSSSLSNSVDCNNYGSKDGVYMSGGPASGGSALGDGRYFFAVLNPGGQNVLTGSAGQMDFVRAGSPALPLLSSDSRDCRTFSVTSGVVGYDNSTFGTCAAPHMTGVTAHSSKPAVQLMPYDNTQNNGGVYILAICSTNVTSASDCKYDAFRIRTAEECPSGDCGPDLSPVLAGFKYYDANLNGQFDYGTEEGIPNWNINVGSSTVTTGAGGAFTSTVDPGTIIVSEQQAGHGWVQTGNTVDQTSSTLNLVSLGPTGSLAKYTYSVVAVFNGSTSYLNFGNVCAPTPGGHTLGFWSNKNGQGLVNANDLAALRAFNLIQPKSSAPYYQAFDPNTAGQVATWLLNGNATNMSYMLGVQMTATYLSLQHNFTTNVNVDNAPAILPGFDPPRNVTQEIAYANALLGANPYTVASGSVRTELERVKSLFDAINNSQSLLQPTLTDGIAVCGRPAFTL